MKKMKSLLALLGISLVSHSIAHAAAIDDMNKANNPLTPMFGLNFQDYITTSLYGMDGSLNNFLLRGIAPHEIGGLPQIFRVTVPYFSVPGGAGGNHITGVGDINFFDIFLMDPIAGIQFGVGPYFVFPTSTNNQTGAGKWQVGASGIAIYPAEWGLAGALLTYQHDFAGASDRPTQSIFTVQPFLIYNLLEAFYLRSVGIWNFDFGTGNFYIPIGLGVGKVWKLESGTVLNLFAEPQWTVAHSGDGVPQFQLFVGLNLQFPVKRPAIGHSTLD